MFLYIAFLDGRIEKHRVKRFSDLSQANSAFYYYEEPGDEKGKGKTFRRDSILNFEVSPYELLDWEEALRKQKEGR